jgi:hypothetical protein
MTIAEHTDVLNAAMRQWVRIDRRQWTTPEDTAQLEVPEEIIPTTILYCGDFDPSGEDMLRSLRERLRCFGVDPVITKGALTADDVARYQLPPEFTKAADTRRAALVAKHGDSAVELDALPVDVLRERLVAEVEALMDLDALADVRRIEAEERQRLADASRDVTDRDKNEHWRALPMPGRLYSDDCWDKIHLNPLTRDGKRVHPCQRCFAEWPGEHPDRPDSAWWRCPNGCNASALDGDVARGHD